MVFSSPHFLFVFLPVLLGLYFVSPQRTRNLLLLAASLLFYSWGEGTSIVILLGSIAGNFLLGRWLDALPGERSRRLVLALAVAFNLALLGFFKYANFVTDNVNVILKLAHAGPLYLRQVHLPLGISFFTFHALSYVLDVYRREVPALRDPVQFALYISFFPQSIAGPIVRYHEVADQLPRRTVTAEGFASGARRFVVGLAKKMLIANTLGVPVKDIFDLPGSMLTPGTAWLGVVCFTLQLYFDFSGYSDMAIGLAQMFGFRFPENFNAPYTARSVTDFWRRWHISLSSWFRDYLYIPLGGNRRGSARTYVNLVAVFFLCGLWHGAGWTFLVWGLFHGVFLILERTRFGTWLGRSARPVQHLYLLFVVAVGWVFFESPTLSRALAHLAAMAGFTRAKQPSANLYLSPNVIATLAVAVICCLPLSAALGRLREALAWPGRPWRAAVAEVLFAVLGTAAFAGLLLASAMQMAGGTYSPFIYFRF